MTPTEIRQAVLDHVVPLMLKQGKPSMDGNTHCKYRSGTHNETLRCALGFLIEDDCYTPSMENKSPSVVGQMNPTSNPIWQKAFSTEMGFLCDLQDCHDTTACECEFDPSINFNSEFLKRAMSLAAAYNLIMEV